MKDIRSFSHCLRLEPADGLEWDYARAPLRRFRLLRMTLYSAPFVRNWGVFLQSV